MIDSEEKSLCSCLDHLERALMISSAGSKKEGIIIFYNICEMIKNINQEPNEMEMSIFTFTHDYYMLELPPP